MLSDLAQRRRRAFTLIELLVVIAVIALLTAISVPLMVRGKEQARRVICRNNIHQFIVALQVYAENYDDFLPPGHCNKRGRRERESHTPLLSDHIRNLLTDSMKTDRVLRCPWLGKPFTTPEKWGYRDYGYLIGYNYLGGHAKTPWPLVGMAEAQWISPQKRTGDPRLPLVTELNAWTTGGNMTFAPHGNKGPIYDDNDDFRNRRSRGIPSKDIGAVGGNIGLLDGSATWKKIADMKIYRASYPRTLEACFGVW